MKRFSYRDVDLYINSIHTGNIMNSTYEVPSGYEDFWNGISRMFIIPYDGFSDPHMNETEINTFNEISEELIDFIKRNSELIGKKIRKIGGYNFYKYKDTRIVDHIGFSIYVNRIDQIIDDSGIRVNDLKGFNLDKKIDLLCNKFNLNPKYKNKLKDRITHCVYITGSKNKVIKCKPLINDHIDFYLKLNSIDEIEKFLNELDGKSELSDGGSAVNKNLLKKYDEFLIKCGTDWDYLYNIGHCIKSMPKIKNKLNE